MRIRTQFVITILLFGIILTAIIASVIITNQQVEKASRQEQIANDIAQEASDLNYLSSDYLIYLESQQLSQWRSKFASFSSDVASLKTDMPEQQALVRSIQSNEQRLKEVFDSVVSTINSQSQNQSGVIDPTVIRDSWGSIAVQSQVLVSDASQLAKLLNAQVDRLQRTNLIVIFAMIGVFGAYFLISYLIIQQRMLKSIDKLRAGTSVIGAGNLDFKLEEKRNDEIGDLSRAFNRMTANLKAATASKVDLESEVAERKQTEEELRETRDYLDNLFNYANAPIIVWTQDFKITRFNHAFERLTGRISDEVIGRKLDILFPDDSRDVSLGHIRDAMAGERWETVEIPIQHVDGSVRIVLWNSATLFDADGKTPVATIAQGQDITERKKVEQILQDNEQRLSQVVDLLEAVTKGTNVIVAVEDTSFRYIFFNQAFKEEMQRITGKDIAIGMSMVDALAHLPEQQDVAVREWSQVLRGEDTNKTMEFGNPGGYRRVYDVLHTPIYDNEGKVIAAGEVAYDVTDRKMAEEELLRVNREMRAITECDKAIVHATDEQMLLNDVCRIMCEVVGYRMAWVGKVVHDKARSVRPVAWAGREEGYLSGANITWSDTELGHGPTGTAARIGKMDFCQDFATETRAAPWREAALARGFRSSIALPLLDNDGNVFGVFTLYAAEPNGFTPTEVQLLEELAGDVAFGISVLRTREERNKAEESLRETRDYLDNLFNYANAPIIVWNPDFKITRFNHAFERLTGRSANEVIGQELDILFPDDSREVSLGHIHDAMAGQRWETVEIPIQHVDGSVRIVLWNSATLFDADGETPVATIAQGQDITERKKVEQIKDEFIGLVSHELKTPITVVMGSVYTALSKGISRKDARMLLLDAASSAESLATIVDNLLELSRAQSDRLMIRREKIDIAETIGAIVDKLRGKSAAHKLLVDLPDSLPPVLADRVRIERIVNNLVDNAVKYSPNGGDVTVFARKEDDYLVVGVKDQGIGISAEDQAKLFQPFERLEMADRVGGVGLGLNVCRRLVEAHQGRIWVESEPDRGATFFFTLPLA